MNFKIIIIIYDSFLNTLLFIFINIPLVENHQKKKEK